MGTSSCPDGDKFLSPCSSLVRTLPSGRFLYSLDCSRHCGSVIVTRYAVRVSKSVSKFTRGKNRRLGIFPEVFKT